MKARYGMGLLMAGLLLGACNDEGMKYVSGPDDPSLRTTSREIEEVRSLLEAQKQKDIAQGIRQPPPPAVAAAATADATAMPEGHPPIHEGETAAPTGGPTVSGRTVNLQVLVGELPEGWTAGPPSVPMRLAEVTIPAVAGDPEAGVIAVFPEIGGGVEANIERWYKQITQPDGSATKDRAKVEFLTAESGLDIILVDVGGTFDGSTMMTPMEPQENWRLLGAIVKAPAGLVFLKGTGPEATMAANREAMLAFLRTLRLPGTAAARVASADQATPAPASPIEPQRVETHGEVPSPGTNVPVAGGGTAGSAVDLGVVTGALPTGWISRPPSSSMRVAEIALPSVAGDTVNGDLVAFYFGPGQGGGVEENIQRWVDQMEGAGEPKRETFYAGGMPVTTVEVAGTFSATSMRPGVASGPPQENFRLLGAVVESPRGSVFIKATGPEATMQAHRERFAEFLKSLQPKL